jgi:DNA-binding NarL/FixJ family response regulator
MDGMPKVLVVDEQRAIVKLVEINLRKAGYDVVPAYSASQALDSIAEARPDLIVADDELLSQIRSHPRAWGIPLISLQRGPFDLRDLLARVDESGLHEWARSLRAWVPRERRRVPGTQAVVIARLRGDWLRLSKALTQAGLLPVLAKDAGDAIEKARGVAAVQVIVVGLPPREADAVRWRLKEYPPTSHVRVLVLADGEAIDRFIDELGRQERGGTEV